MSTFTVVSNDVNKGKLELIQPIITKLENHMPHWTSETNDKTVYTTVDEAHSGSVDEHFFKLN